mgnify:CR=1 FL=1|jgi:hypothetical protein
MLKPGNTIPTTGTRIAGKYDAAIILYIFFILIILSINYSSFTIINVKFLRKIKKLC